MVLGLGSWEILLVGLALLVLFGPEHAPELIRKIGRMQARARRTISQLEEAIEQEEEEVREGFPTSRDELPSSGEDPDEEERP
jgi:Sec-independent protein translocase protein TatA